jgi:hypothetical protein
MRIVLALAVFVTSASASAIAEEAPRTVKPSRMAIICKKSSEKISGLTKICYYNCAGSEGALTVTTYEACPNWRPRWRLNRTGPFGPSAISR